MSYADRQYKRVLKAAQDDLLSFTMTMNAKYKPNWHHEVMAKVLQSVYERVQNGESPRVMLNLPPRNGKSELASINFPAWVLGKDPTIPIIECSYSADLAQRFSSSTRSVVREPMYKEIFPNTVIRNDTTSKKHWKLTEGGSLSAAGVSGPITGTGAKILLIDDPVKDAEESQSQIVRDKTYEWYTGTALTRLNGAGAVIIIMTRWHLDDLSGRILAKEKEDIANGLLDKSEWEIIQFPAIATEDEEFRKKGEPLWKEQFNLDALIRIKRNVGDRNWYSQYQQNPIAVENATFKKEWFKYYLASDLDGKDLHYATTVDPAISQATRADNSVVMTVAKERSTGNWYIVEMTFGKLHPSELMDAVFMHFEKYHSSVWIETAAYQKILVYNMRDEMKRRKVYFKVNELKYQNSKENRIDGLEPLYRDGLIYHHRDLAELEQELLQYPFSAHDDMVDSLASQLVAQPPTKFKMSKPIEQKPFGNYYVMRR